MFISGTGAVFEKLPDLKDLRASDARRNLSTAYIDAFTASIAAQRSTGESREVYEQYLRRLANSLESHAVFDGDVVKETRLASAFVAAESLMLLLDLRIEVALGDFSLSNPFVFDALEASLLYVSCGYDANAAVVVQRLLKRTRRKEPADNETIALAAITTLCGGDRAFSGIPDAVTEDMILSDPTSTARSVLFAKIAVAIGRFLRWRGGDDEEGYDDCFLQLDAIIKVLTRPEDGAYAHILHIVRVLYFSLTYMGERAVRTISPPSGEHKEVYLNYLTVRAKVRPVMWPTAIEYAQACLPGPHASAVVNVPTGGGKSFIAELAISQAILDGWALYLVPTNALAAQVRRDLEEAMEAIPSLDVRAFLGGEEYTDLSTEQLQNVAPGTIVVMTPEKCALALRLSERVFKTCRLCVFDECHLLGEGARGALAELVLSHIIALATSCKFLLMSAMMSNPDELAEWLTEATGAVCNPIREPWRPTRTMRGLLGADGSQMELYKAACDYLIKEKDAKSKSFNSGYALLTNLQGVWGSNLDQDYALVQMPFRSKFKLQKKTRGRAAILDVASWINTAAEAAALHFVNQGHSVLTFLPANKHYAFSVGEKLAPALRQTVKLDEKSLDLLTIAEDELGGESRVRALLKQGIAVHTARLLDSEKAVSEYCFQEGLCKVMFATGTLAQGLNLPASVVLVGGTKVGDARLADNPQQQHRAKLQILNALGRAGRAGFANHGISVLIPDRIAFLASRNLASEASSHSAILADDENSSKISSSLEGFLQSIFQRQVAVESTDEQHLTALSYLPIVEGSEETIETIISKTFAIRWFPAGYRAIFGELAKDSLMQLGSSYLAKKGAPTWLPLVAYRTGLPLPVCIRIFESFQRCAHQLSDAPTTIIQWAEFFFDCLHFLTPKALLSVLGKDGVQGVPSSLIWDEAFAELDDPEWVPPTVWETALDSLISSVDAYMTGSTIADVASLFLDIPVVLNFDRSAGKPIPKTLTVVKDFVNGLSQVAGAIIVIEEQTGILSNRNLSDRAKLCLSSLPLAIKYGCDSRSCLSWYRFGVQYRRAAHVLSRILPLPDEDCDDEAARGWINRTKYEFLSLDLADFRNYMVEGELSLLTAVQGLLTR